MAVKSSVLLVTEDEYLPVLLKLLDSARTSIDVLAFSFAIGSARGQVGTAGAPFEVAEKLKEIKAKRGKKLTIRLYIEGRRDTADRNAVTVAYLKKAGVKVKNGSTHAKGFCVDGRYVLFGSTNLTNQSMTKNNETNLLLNDAAAVAGFQKYFDHLWKGGRHGGVKLPPPMIADGGFKDALIGQIGRAKKTIDFSIYFFQQKEIEAALIKAVKRGVKIRGFIHDHRAFAMSYVRRTRATVARLKEAGVKDLHFGPNHLFTHSKYLVSDRRQILLGTGNWLDEDVEIHPQLYIALDDAKLARQIVSHLKGQINAG